MQIDLELYRREARVAIRPDVRLSVIDISPDLAHYPMVFVHGFGGRAIQWRYQLHEFSSANRVIAMDLRGHGLSDKPRQGYSMAQILNDLTMVLDTMGLTDNIILAGHSFGGAVVSEFAVANPERIAGLILIATTGEFKLNPLYRLLLKLPYTSLQGLAPFTRKWLGAPPHIMKAWHDHTIAKWRGWELFRKIQAPTLVIRGHMDAVFAKPLFEQVAQTIPGAEEVDVGASGHMVMLERHAAVNRAISRFLNLERRSWSDTRFPGSMSFSASLHEERPWLSQYQSDVPYTIATPRVPVAHLLSSSANRFPNHSALIFEGKRITYRRLNTEANQFAHFLHDLGVQKGDRVMLILPNMPQAVIAFYGTLKAGATVVFSLPVNEPQELIRQIVDSGASILVTLTQFDELIYQVKNLMDSDPSSPLKHIIFSHISDYLPIGKRIGLLFSRKMREAHLLDIPLDTSMHQFKRGLKKRSKGEPDLEIKTRDLAVIQYTGGTTANPKGVMLSHSNLVANTIQTRHWMPQAKEKAERFLCVLPFSHSYGMTAALNVPIALGATLILKPKFDTENILQAIHKYRPTIFPGVPQMYVAIKDYRGVRKYGVQSISACISGAAPLPVEVKEAFEKLTRGKLVEGYGLTEASPVTHANPLDDGGKVGSIGLPLPSTEARIVDLTKAQQEVRSGQIGELAIRGPQVMMGYWNNPEASDQVLSRDGWLLTGDVAQMDRDGFFRIVARKADMWYPTQPNKPAFPRDLEEVLFEIPQVKEAAVVAIAGQPVAFIIARSERPAAEAIIAYCKRRLPPELAPRLVIFMDDFPRTFIGKVLRRELAQYFTASQEISGKNLLEEQSVWSEMIQASLESINENRDRLRHVEMGEGPTVFLLHGMGSSRHDWAALMPMIAEAGFRAISVDLFGHGDSARPDAPSYYTIDHIYKSMEQWIDSLEVEPPYMFVGHSMGGYLTLLYSATHPENVQAISLIAPLYNRKQINAALRFFSRAPHVGVRLLPFIPLNWIDYFLGWDPVTSTQFSPQTRLQIAIDIKRASPHILNIPRSVNALTPLLHEINMPAQVIWGDKDLTLKPKSFEELVSLLPEADGHKIPHSGHQPHVGRPEIVNPLILKFIKNNARQ